MTGNDLLNWLLAQPAEVLACDVYSRGARYGELLAASPATEARWRTPEGSVNTIMIEGSYAEAEV